jgi:hypothetical protein
MKALARIRRWLDAFQAQSKVADVQCRHDGTPPYCMPCVCVYLPIP